MNRICLILLIVCSLFTASRLSASPPGNTQGNQSRDQRLDNLATQIANNLTENQKRTIAIVEFGDLQGNVTNLGRFLSEELITRLYQTKKFKVIERQQLNKIVAEQKLTLTGMIDPATAQKLGRVLAVDSIVFASLSDLVKTVKINARLISAETGEVFAAAAIEIEKDTVIEGLMGENLAGPTPSPSPSRSPRAPRTWRIESHRFTFDLQRCRLSGTSVLCEFTITNNDRDRRLKIDSDTRMFDDFGNEAEARNFQIADKTGTYSVTAALITGVPVKARMTFEGISVQATRMTLFHLRFWTDEGQFEIEYRNIPLRDQVGESNSFGNLKSSRQVSLQVSPGQWFDSGIDVEPGMKFDVTATGSLTAKSDNRAVSNVLSEVLGQRVNIPPSTRTVGPKALFAKIQNRNGRYSKPVVVGEKSSFTIESNEAGRLYFGIDSKYAKYSGSFAVTLNW